MKFIKLIFNILFVLSTIQVFAQTTVMKNRFEGYVISSDLNKKEVIIEVEDSSQPFAFQENIKYFDKSLLSNGRIKREDKKDLVAGEFIEYGFDKKKFVFVEYYVKGESEDNVLKSTFGKFKGDKNTHFFAETTDYNGFSIHQFYIPPTITDEDYDDEKGLEKKLVEAAENYDFLISVKGISPEPISTANLSKLFAPCPALVKKIENDMYKFNKNKSLKDKFKGDKTLGLPLKKVVDRFINDATTLCP